MFFQRFVNKEPINKVHKGSIEPVVVLVLDGWGIAPPSEGNAIELANKANFSKYIKTYPNGRLIASGESVGLPANEEGNSEVGHLTIGAGRVVPQSLIRIRDSIKNLTFYENEALNAAKKHVYQNNSKLHIIGLVGSGEVHASIKHLYALLEFCKRKEIQKVYLHLFTDGRDSPPHEAKKIVSEINSELEKLPNKIKIASIAGRYYAMDRDMRWDRTEKVYNAMVLGQGIYASSATEAIEKAYADSKTDEFIEPTVITEFGKPVALVEDNDAVIFFNFRIDRPRQLTMAFTFENFENLEKFEFKDYENEEERAESITAGKTFKREKIIKNLFFVTMTEYQKEIPVSAIAFPPIHITDSISHIISNYGLNHFHLAESEKERMVTYYFNGMTEENLPKETVKIVPSPKVSTYDKKPEMSTPEIVNEFINAINTSKYHFYIINFACPDMVAHTGDIKATIKAIEAADKGMGAIVNATLINNGTAIITADHGNAEELISYPLGSYYYTSNKGAVNTSHSNNPVPVILISNALAKVGPKKLSQGTLSDIGPTVLKRLNLPVPPTMTGHDLLAGII